MKYATIEKSDINNGEGVRVSLWTMGCPHHCKGCFNPETWDASKGKEFTEESFNELIDAMNGTIHQRDLSILGGEPLADYNYDGVLEICKKVKSLRKNIWVWSGYTFDELIEQGKSEIFKYIDVLVDGKFEENLKDEKLQWKGSSNQRVIDVKKTLVGTGEIILYSK